MSLCQNRNQDIRVVGEGNSELGHVLIIIAIRNKQFMDQYGPMGQPHLEATALEDIFQVLKEPESMFKTTQTVFVKSIQPNLLILFHF